MTALLSCRIRRQKVGRNVTTPSPSLKFFFSKKATKFEEIFLLVVLILSHVKPRTAFSENLNFDRVHIILFLRFYFEGLTPFFL
jgi:hypothetical protein